MNPTPAPTSAVESSSAVLGQPHVHTYHCLCTHLIVATTTPLSSLPRRSTSSLDKACILILPSPQSTHSPPLDDSDSEAEAEAEAEAEGEPFTSQEKSLPKPSSHYALLLSTVVDRKPQIITRSDGFEKRYLQRCGRCRLVVGYQLEWGQYTDADAGMGDRVGRRENVVYLLPGGLMSTEEMVEGKDMASNITLEA